MAIIIEIGLPDSAKIGTETIAYIPTSQVFLNDIDDASENDFSTWSSAKIKAFIAAQIEEALANYAPPVNDNNIYLTRADGTQLKRADGTFLIREPSNDILLTRADGTFLTRADGTQFKRI